jgi:putative transposase
MQNIHADLFMAAGAGFVSCLKKADVAISMDGRGRALDNIFVERLWRSVKYEDIYLKGYATVPELRLGLTEYFEFYNTERPHQPLGYEVPDTVYKTAVGGGAYIVDKFSGIKEKVFTELGQRHSAVC